MRGRLAKTDADPRYVLTALVPLYVHADTEDPPAWVW